MVGARCYDGGDLPSWKKSKVMDIFGPWEQYDALSLEIAACYTVPCVRVPRGEVMLVNVELDSDRRIPFTVFDSLRTAHNVDVTGLAMSLTHRGNLYRAQVLHGASTVR